MDGNSCSSANDGSEIGSRPFVNSRHETTAWVRRYGKKHHPKRVSRFPGGIVPPRKVRIYARNGHFLLQWWDRGAGRTLNERVDGDLIDAVARARHIDQRLDSFATAATPKPRLGHGPLVEAFLADFEKRADAGTVAPPTPRRYRSALAHYLAYTQQPGVSSQYAQVSRVDREFALGFAAHVNNLMVQPNGRPGARPRRIRGQRFILDAVRAMFEWAADDQRGNLLPVGFRNPFRRGVLSRRTVNHDPVGEPDITVQMAAAFVGACDAYQRRLFLPMILYPMRAAEPVMLFHEMIDGQFLQVACIEELEYFTKGRRNKLLPLMPALSSILQGNSGEPTCGLLYTRRAVQSGIDKPPLLGASLKDLIAEYERRCAAIPVPSALARAKIRARVIAEAGGLTYKLIEGEFRSIATRLAWPKEATLKDFRHLTNTLLLNAGLSQEERRYLMGQSLGKSAIINYTHLNRLKDRYAAAVAQEFGPILDSVTRSIGT